MLLEAGGRVHLHVPLRGAEACHTVAQAASYSAPSPIAFVYEKEPHYSIWSLEFAPFDQASGLRSCGVFDGNRSAAGFCWCESASFAKNTDLRGTCSLPASDRRCLLASPHLAKGAF